MKKCEESAKKMLIYHEKNPEKHPLYPVEWKKFWNRRYKELQAGNWDCQQNYYCVTYFYCVIIKLR